MKKTMIVAILAFSSMGFAKATCPTDTQKLMTCESKPQPGDSEFAAEIFETVTVCAGKEKSFLVPTKNGASEALEAQSIVRAGGNAFLISTKEVDLQLSMVSGTAGLTKLAKLTVTYNEAKVSGSSTYKCKR